MEVIKNDDELYEIIRELKILDAHIKTYNEGAYPAFYLQMKTAFRVVDILSLKLKDLYEVVDGTITVKDRVTVNGTTFKLKPEDKMTFATYILHRTPIDIEEDEENILNDFLCVNKQGNQLTNQVYRKLLERAVYELSLKHDFNTFYLHSLYGYFQFVFAKKTIPALMKEYHCSKYYLINQIWKGFEIGYASRVVHQAAGITETEEDAYE